MLRAARDLNEAADLTDALERLLDRAIELVGADEGSVMLLGADRRLRVHSSRGLSPEVVSASEVLLGEGISGRVAASGRPLVLHGDAMEDLLGTAAPHRRLQSAMSVPLRDRDGVAGVLNLNRTARGRHHAPFHTRERATAELFAEFAASAVRTFSAAEGLRRSRDIHARLFEASHSLLATVDLSGTAEQLLDAAAMLVGADGGFVAVPERDGSLHVVATRGLARGRVLATVRRPGFGDLFGVDGSQIVPRPQDDEVLARLVGTEEDRAAVVVPLVAAEGARGLLIAMVPGTGPSTQAQASLATFASSAALALGRARLFRDLTAKQDELRMLAGAVPDPVIVADADGTILSLNPAACSAFSLHPTFDVGGPITGKLRSNELEQLLLDGGSARRDVTVHHPQPRTYRARVAGVRPGQGMSGARILICEDVTAEADLAKVKSDFVAVIGHELRTPLTLVKGYGQTLERNMERMDASARARAISTVNVQAGKLERLIEDLLLISRVERTRPPLDLSEVDLGRTLERILDDLSRRHDGRRIELLPGASGAQCSLDVTKLEQVLSHLVDNAVKFSEAPAPVTVSYEVDADDVLVSVTDQGIGVYSGDHGRLFDRFQQVDGSHTRTHGGTGVGLHICKLLVDAHQGQVGVRSALGRGSTFWFRLPRRPSPTSSGTAGTVDAAQAR